MATHPAIAARLSQAQKTALDRQLLVWWDGRLVWHTALRYFADRFDTIALGSNPQQFSSSSALYAGAFFPEPVTEAEIQAAIDQALAVQK